MKRKIARQQKRSHAFWLINLIGFTCFVAVVIFITEHNDRPVGETSTVRSLPQPAFSETPPLAPVDPRCQPKTRAEELLMETTFFSYPQQQVLPNGGLSPGPIVAETWSCPRAVSNIPENERRSPSLLKACGCTKVR